MRPCRGKSFCCFALWSLCFPQNSPKLQWHPQGQWGWRWVNPLTWSARQLESRDLLSPGTGWTTTARQYWEAPCPWSPTLSCRFIHPLCMLVFMPYCRHLKVYHCSCFCFCFVFLSDFGCTAWGQRHIHLHSSEQPGQIRDSGRGDYRRWTPGSNCAPCHRAWASGGCSGGDNYGSTLWCPR